MKTLLTLPLLLLSLMSFPSWGETIDNLVERDGIHYKKFSDIPFTGKVSGKLSGSYKNGKAEGEWIAYWDNGQLDAKGSFKNGKRVGEWIHYHENGQLWMKSSYKNGKEEGFWEVYYDNGHLESEGEFKKGEGGVFYRIGLC